MKQKIDPANLPDIQVDGSDADLLREALVHAVHYRGDVTVHRRAGAASVDGYLFDQRRDDSGTLVSVRLVPREADEPVTIAVDEISGVHFSGRDTAAGKSWETWVRKYIERKSAEQES